MQKVLQVGSSAGVTISKEALKLLNIKVGDFINVDVDHKHGSIVILPIREPRDGAEFSAWTKEFVSQYGPALQALAKK